MRTVTKRAIRVYEKDSAGDVVRDSEGRPISRISSYRFTARYTDPNGKVCAKNFKLKRDADRWLDEHTADVLTNRYVEPSAGKVTFAHFAEQWRTSQPHHRPGTQEQVERALRLYVYPEIGGRTLASIKPIDVRLLVATMSKKIAPSTLRVTYRYVSTIFKAAVTDKKISESPCVKIKLPTVHKTTVKPLPTSTVHAIAESVAPHYRALILAAAGTGLRQGELFGLTWDRIDAKAGKITVDRQMIVSRGVKPAFGPPKTEASYRKVPLPRSVADALNAHLLEFGEGPDRLVFTNDLGDPLRRSQFGMAWRRALARAGLSGIVFHELRHYYASLLIRYGESVNVVQARLGHKSADETLSTYAHLWPDSDDRTRAAVDDVLAAPHLVDS